MNSETTDVARKTLTLSGIFREKDGIDDVDGSRGIVGLRTSRFGDRSDDVFCVPLTSGKLEDKNVSSVSMTRKSSI